MATTTKRKEEAVKTVEEIKEVKTTTDKKEPIKQPKKTRKDLRKLITNDLEIVVMNNTNGTFVYECPRTHRSYKMTSYGDIDYITYEELNAMINAHRNILEGYWILPIDVVSDDVTLNEVLEFAGVKGYYKGDMLEQDFMDNLLLDVDIDEFKKIIESVSNKYTVSIIDRAVALFKDNTFNDFSKMTLLEEISGRDELFKEVAEQMQDK